MFSIVTSFTGNMEDRYCGDGPFLSDVVRVCKEAGLICGEPTEPGNSEYSYLSEETDDPEDWRYHLQDFEASGFIDREHFDFLVSKLGLHASSCKTLGTIGAPFFVAQERYGPMPDIAFEMDSPNVIECVRVTPIPWSRRKDQPQKGNELTWPRLRKAVLSVYG